MTERETVEWILVTWPLVRFESSLKAIRSLHIHSSKEEIHPQNQGLTSVDSGGLNSILAYLSVGSHTLSQLVIPHIYLNRITTENFCISIMIQ